MRTLRFTMAIAFAAIMASTSTAGAETIQPDDHLRAVNIVPTGQSGFVSAATFAQVQAGTTSSYGANFADQLPLYSAWKYKPFQFLPAAGGSHPGGNSHVSITRDSFGVPSIEADNEADLAFGMGYAMAQDRLFQIDVLRHVGHGTLAEMTGPSGIASDYLVRQVTEGAAARTAELAAQSPDLQARAQRFADGINQSMGEQCPVFAAPTCPVEYQLLFTGNLKPVAWTTDDTLAFGEYAGRFFGEFGHDEVNAARSYVDLVNKLGQPAAEKAFNDLYKVSDPLAPTIIAPADGTFPRHTGSPAPGTFSGSPFLNHDPAVLPTMASIESAQAQINRVSQMASSAAEKMGIPRHFGSNAIAVSGTRTADGNPMLYSGPQTGWAVPGFFWEVEMKDPVRHTRGVAVPAIPLMVIGRNEDSSFSVTSALDGNSDTYVEQLNADNSMYLHGGQWLPVVKQVQTINCNNVATGLLPLTKGQPPTLCPNPAVTVNVYQTMHGSGLTDPDSTHHLYVRRSSVSNHLVESLAAWDSAGLQHTAASFGDALSKSWLGFNYFYVDTAGEVAYFHTGRYPIRPSNADPTLPLPGDGGYEWQGFEKWSDLPHVINPSAGFLDNWNNKPARDWVSKDTASDSNASNRWGLEHHVNNLTDVVRAGQKLTLDDVGQLPRKVAYLDRRAQVLIPSLAPVLDGSGDPTLAGLGASLEAWDRQRLDSPDHKLHTAPTFFDRWLEHMLADTLGPALGPKDLAVIEGLNCSVQVCGLYPSGPHFVSTDNLDVPTMKLDLSATFTLIQQLRGLNQYDFLGGVSASAVMLQAAREAAAELGSEQGTTDSSKWSEPVEAMHFSPQGAGSVPDTLPLPNRGSYGQVVEALASGALVAASPGPVSLPLPATARGAVAVLPLALLLLAAGLMLGRTRRRRAGECRDRPRLRAARSSAAAVLG